MRGPQGTLFGRNTTAGIVNIISARPTEAFEAYGSASYGTYSTTNVEAAVSGPLFGFSDTWQLVINTTTTIITFLMVFLIQNTQNRDALALQIKLAELIIAMRGAHNQVAAVEDLSEDELEALHCEYRRRADATLDSLERRRTRRAA